MQVLGTTGGAAGQGGAPSMSRQPGDDRADLYDATSHIWLELFGEHVHVGLYADAGEAQRSSKSWQQAQCDHVTSLLKASGVKQAQQVADMGCGYGGTAVLVAQQLHCKAVGVNISPFQVQAANSLAARTGFTPADVHFVVGDALAPTLPPASFDLVLAVESSAYMPDKEKFVAQLARLARPGGTVVVVDFFRRHGGVSERLAQRMARMDAIFATAGNWKSAQEFSSMMAANGLQVVKREDWSDRIRGFWSIPLLELLFRQGHGTQALHARALEGCLRSVRVGWLLVTGGSKVAQMTWSMLSGAMARTVQDGLDCGDLEYQVIVARKP